MRLKRLWIIGIPVLLLSGCASLPEPGGVDADASSWSKAPVRFYQQYLSEIDGDRCSMHPSCSNYCLNAIEKHGPLAGWIMCCDRLMRCGRDEIAIASSVWINGKKYCHDPVGANDFWRIDSHEFK